MKREELIAYDKWLRRKWWTGEIISPEKAADLYLAEHPIPPAEGAEQVQRCPVCMGKGLVPNNFYATTSGIGSTTQTYLPEKCRTCNGAGVIILPYPKLQPTAEGAEEILATTPCSIIPVDEDAPLNDPKNLFYYHKDVVKAMQKFATLHAQQMAEKMVEEKLREELIAILSWWRMKTRDGIYAESEVFVDEYLKSRDSHD